MASPSDKPVENLGEFVSRVQEYREFWGNEEHHELWFRGESKDYGETKLRPELYRPAEGMALKPIRELLEIEWRLYEEFQRAAVERCGVVSSSEDWDWDSYFLMQHHEGPTRLLDWSDGGLMALHFAVRNRSEDDQPGESYVYVLEPYRLLNELDALPDRQVMKDQWKAYVQKNPGSDLDEDEWDEMYLPPDASDDDIGLPRPPLLLDFPLITRRFAAQRSRFVAFGTEPRWLAEHFERADSFIKRIAIPSNERPKIRQQLRDCGITESVIYPDLDGLGREMRQLWEDRKAK